MTGPLVDTHAHLADLALAADIDGVLGRAAEAGVVQVVAVGTTAEDGARLLEGTAGRAGVFATVGIHPNHAAAAAPGDRDRVVALADSPRVVAIGETGLDRHWKDTPFALQQEYFDFHLDLARDLDLPVIIHCRESADDILAQLRRRGVPIRGVLHSFTGDPDQARAFLELGLMLSLAGMITFANKSLDPLRRAAAAIPSDRLLVETDSPYLSPHPFRGKVNEPARVAITAARLSEIRGIGPVEFAAATTANARRLFRLDAADVLRLPAE